MHFHISLHIYFNSRRGKSVLVYCLLDTAAWNITRRNSALVKPKYVSSWLKFSVTNDCFYYQKLHGLIRKFNCSGFIGSYFTSPAPTRVWSAATEVRITLYTGYLTHPWRQMCVLVHLWLPAPHRPWRRGQDSSCTQEEADLCATALCCAPSKTSTVHTGAARTCWCRQTSE